MRLRNIDKYIQSKLQNFRPYHNGKDEIWNNIARELDNLKPAPAPKLYGRIAAAALVILALIPVYKLTFHQAPLHHNSLTGRTAVPSSENAGVRENRLTANYDVHSAQNQKKYTSSAGRAISAPAVKDVHTGNTLSSAVNIDNQSKQAATLLATNNSAEHKRLRRNKIPANTAYGNENQEPETNANLQLAYSDIDIYTASLQATKEMADRDSFIKSNVMPLTERPLLLATASGRRPLIKTRKSKNAPVMEDHMSSSPQYWANWQSVYYHFWDNPAFTGQEGRYNFNIDDQITKTDNSLRPAFVNHFAFDMQIPRYGIGLGLYHQREVGITSLNTRTGLAASVHLLSLGDGELTGGVSATYIQKNNFSKLFIFSDRFDPVFGFIQDDKYNHFSHSISTIAYNTGLWYSSSHTIAGLDVQNVNNPVFGGVYDATRIPIQWRATLGYRFEIGRSLQVMPWIEAIHIENTNVYSSRLMAVYRNAYMLGISYEGVDQETRLGNLMYMASVQVKKRVRLFASYGKNLEMAQNGIEQNILYTGLRVQLH